MPLVQRILLFAADNGSCPLLDWLDGLPSRAQQKFLAQLHMLQDFAAPLDPLDEEDSGIKHAQIACQGTKYGLAYFVHDSCAVLVHAWTCGANGDSGQIAVAVERRLQFQINPPAHTYSG
jgi:hypothetical protein